jgi:RNA polymerase sigma-70 factor (ECF subfamily)
MAAELSAMDESTERTAITRVLAGDLDAFGVILDRYQDAIHAFFRARTPDLAQADELTQMTFVTAYERLAHFDRQQPLRPWLYGIARKLMLQTWDRARRETRGRNSFLGWLRQQMVSEPTVSDPDPDGVVDRLAALEHCMLQLPFRWREIIGMHYQQGLSLAAIASQLGNAPATVGVTLFRSRQRLRVCIERHLAHESQP